MIGIDKGDGTIEVRDRDGRVVSRTTVRDVAEAMRTGLDRHGRPVKPVAR